MSEHFVYLLSWLVNAFLIYLAHVIFKDAVVLGTFKFNVAESSFYAGFWATFLIWLFKDMVSVRGLHPDSKLGGILFSVLAGTVAIWVTARFAPFTGLGIINYRWAILIGLFVGLAQQRVRGFVDKNRG